MIDLLKVNQRLRAGVALKTAWLGFEDGFAEAPAAGEGPPESWGMAVVAAQLSWRQVLLLELQKGVAEQVFAKLWLAAT